MSATQHADLVDRLTAGDFAAVDWHCAEHGMGLPKLIWSPETADLDHAPLRFLMDYWRGLRDGDDLPRASAIDPTGMRPALGNVMLLDVLQGGADFRYRLYGSNIALHAGFDMTGKRVSDIKTGSAVATFFTLVYQAVLKRREPIYTEHRPPATISVTKWHRLILPLTDADGAINRLLVGNMPGDWRPPQTGGTAAD